LLEKGKLAEEIASEFNTPLDEDYEKAGGIQHMQSLLKNNFYTPNELTDDEFKFLKRFHQYELYKAPNFGDGFTDVIIGTPVGEGKEHLVLKNLFARLHNSAVMEYHFDKKSEHRADVAYLPKTTLKIAVEIERGTNKIDYLKEKVQKLSQHFHKIILVCKREDLTKYKRFAQEDKVFVMTAKEAKLQVLDWLK